MLRFCRFMLLVAVVWFEAPITNAAYLEQAPLPIHDNFPHAFELRNATITDAEDCARVIVDAFKNDPVTQYVSQFRDAYPDDAVACLSDEFRQLIEIDLGITQVIVMPSREDPSISKVVATAVWARPEPRDARFASFMSNLVSRCTYESVNMTRAIDWNEKLRKVKSHYFDQFYSAGHLYLAAVGTLPDYQRHGAATQLVLSGLAMAKQYGVDATLIATKRGEPVYHHLGFESIANLSIPSIDNDRTFPFDVMFYNMSGQTAS